MKEKNNFEKQLDKHLQLFCKQFDQQMKKHFAKLTKDVNNTLEDASNEIITAFKPLLENLEIRQQERKKIFTNIEHS